jgi:hypothetical protein
LPQYSIGTPKGQSENNNTGGHPSKYRAIIMLEN